MVVSYDIESNRLRTRFAKFLEKYGTRLQYSVFVLPYSARGREVIIEEITHHFEDKFGNGDSIVIFSLCEACEKKRVVFGCERHDMTSLIVIGDG